MDKMMETTGAKVPYEKMKYLVGLCLMMTVFSTQIFAGGINSWQQNTPGGNRLSYESAYPHENTILTCLKELDTLNPVVGKTGISLKRWYYYRNHVAGQLADPSASKFFIFWEENCTLLIFDSKEEFNEYLKIFDLAPEIVTRWYTTYHGYLVPSAACGFCGITYLLRWLAALLVSSITVYLARKYGNLISKMIAIGWHLAVIARILLDVSPGSF